jgi:hypothetical protein
VSLELLARWRPLLAELGDLGEALCEAITSADVLTAIAAMARMRQVRAEIARVEAPAKLRGDREEIAAMLEVTTQTVRARGAEAAMTHWLARSVPGDAVLLSTPLGIAALADAMLPPVWDYASDVVVLVGAGLEPVAEVLAGLGQARVIIVGGEPATNAIAAETADEVVAAIRTMTPCVPTRMVIRAALGVARETAEEMTAAVREAMSDLRIHRNTVRAFSDVWIQQGAANMHAIAQWPSVAAIGDRFAGVPIVIVAPGPSLAINAHLLPALRGKAIICAFSHSLKPVLAAGVMPDVVVTVDPQDVRYHFAGCDVSQTCLVNAATVHPSLFELVERAVPEAGAPESMTRGRCLTLSANCAIDDWIFDGVGENAIVPGGGSVATTAFSLALRWRCDPIIFVGLDLSFPGGNYYVSTSSDGSARAVVDDRGIMRVEGWSDSFRAMKAGGGPSAVAERAVELPGWHGGSVPSSFMFSMFHRWFVERMKQVADVRVYNCTEGGAAIAGMRHESLATVVAELPSGVDARAVIDDAIAATDRRERARRIGAHLGGFLRALRKCRRLARRARVLAQRGEDSARLVAVEKDLAAALQPMPFASLLAQREIERAHDVARRAGDTAGYLDASASLFGTLIGVIDRIEPALAAAERRNHGG